jgi:uncharacterized protein DUF4242
MGGTEAAVRVGDKFDHHPQTVDAANDLAFSRLTAIASAQSPRARRRVMPLYMDVHTLGSEVSAADVAEAHQKDVETQDKYGVDYKSYWVDEKAGKIFCLVEAPDAEAARTVHREAHGLVADEIYEVHQGA